MVRVKICGITNLSDALAAVDAGADALGFNFYRRSPRYIDPVEAGEIIRNLPAFVMTVGIFVNETKETVESVASEARVQAVQLHGDETPEMCASLKSSHVIKAFRAQESFDPENVKLYQTEAVLLDAYDPEAWGGTGQTSNWSVARSVREMVAKLYLAGGLTCDNVSEAVKSVEPYAVDVCSGVERERGQKDHVLLRKFVEAAKRAG